MSNPASVQVHPQKRESSSSSRAHLPHEEEEKEEVVVEDTQSSCAPAHLEEREAWVKVALIIEKLAASATPDRRATLRRVLARNNKHDCTCAIRQLFKLVGDGPNISHAMKAGIKALAALYLYADDEDDTGDGASAADLLKPLTTLTARDMAPLIEHLAGAQRPKAERILTILKAIALSGFQGQSFLADHALTIPALVRSLLVLSDLCNELAIHVLWLLCLHHPARLAEAAQFGLAHKLFVLAQMNCAPITKHRICDLLKAMKGMSCLTPLLHASQRL